MARIAKRKVESEKKLDPAHLRAPVVSNGLFCERHCVYVCVSVKNRCAMDVCFVFCSLTMNFEFFSWRAAELL